MKGVVGSQIRHRLWRYFAELAGAEIREHMEVPHARVAAERGGGEVRLGVHRPPLTSELAELPLYGR